jgi:hypothetical protein
VADLKALQSGLDVRTELAASPYVHGDRERLALAVRDLCHEAALAIAPGSPLTLKLDQEGSYANLSLSFQALPEVERLYSGHEDADDSSISHCAAETIIEAHGGQLGEYGGGGATTLWIRLPVEMAA